MKFSKHCHPEMCAAKFGGRYATRRLYLRGSRLEATDGRKLVLLNVEREDGDSDGFVEVEHVKRARKLADTFDPSVRMNGVAEFTDGSTMPRRADPADSFPNTDNIVAQAESYGRPTLTIRLDPRLLWAVAQGLGADRSDDGLTLDFWSPDHLIRVSNASGTGYVMPMVQD